MLLTPFRREYSPVQSCQETAVDNPGNGEWGARIDDSKPARVTAKKQGQEDRRTDRELYIGFLRDQVEYDRILQEDTYGEDDDGCIGRNLAGGGTDEVGRVHGPHDKGGEKGHHHAGDEGQDDALALVGLGNAAVSLAAGSHAVADNS